MNIDQRGIWEPVDTDLTSMVYNQQGELVGIERSKRKIGATIIYPERFKASVAENNPSMEPWTALLLGMIIGASLLAGMLAAMYLVIP